MDLPFYLAFPTGIYLFKINNKNRTIFCKICPNLTRKVPDQMSATKFLKMRSFSILSALWIHHFHCYSISTATLKFPPWFPASPPWFSTIFAFPSRFFTFPNWFLTPAFPSHSSHSHPYSLHFSHSVPQFPILDFTNSLLSL